MPYAVSWMLYQGSLLMSVLNWTGLIVNGLVAFLLPMILALKSTELLSHRRRARGVDIFLHSKPDIMITRESHRFSRSVDESYLQDGIELALTEHLGSGKQYLSTENSQPSDEISPRDRAFSMSQSADSPTENNRNLLHARIQNTRVVSSPTVQPLPIELEIYRREIVLFMILAFATIIMMTIMEDALQGISPTSEET